MTAADQAALKAAVQGPPQDVAVPLANWTGKAVRHFLTDKGKRTLGRRSCLRALHRLDVVWKRPMKRLLKADAAKRAQFVRDYATVRADAQQTGATIVFVDEAQFYADADLRGKRVLQGHPALVESSRPRYGEKARDSSAVCLETGAVDVRASDETRTAKTRTAFLRQLRAAHAEPLIVIWDNGPAHGGEAIREDLQPPDRRLRLLRLPAYRPDDNADEPSWQWIREEVTGNSCFGTKATVREHVDAFFQGLSTRATEVRARCRTRLQAEVELLGSHSM